MDRPAWIAANLRTMRPMLAPLSERMGDGRAACCRCRCARSRALLLGAQVGALTGVLSQRVLGQYDLALLELDVPPRLLLLAPNLAQAARTLGVDRDELVAVGDASTRSPTRCSSRARPGCASYLGGMLTELIDGLQVAVAGDDPGARATLPSLPDAGDLREMVERARGGELLRLTLGEDRWQLVERMQAAMSLIEGHAEHTMDVIGAERAAVARRACGRR